MVQVAVLIIDGIIAYCYDGAIQYNQPVCVEKKNVKQVCAIEMKFG